MQPQASSNSGGATSVAGCSDHVPSVERKRRKRKRCGVCEGCLRDDCGQCRHCRDKTKFGGPGIKKQRCLLRACSNMVHNSKLEKVSLEQEEDITSVMITCQSCGRKRKKGLSRSSVFCSLRCLTKWQDSHCGELPQEAITGLAISPEPKTSGITLSPSPAPLSSPAPYTPPSSNSPKDKANFAKWKEISRKLYVHSKLRSVWNELRAKRQCVQHDVLSLNTPVGDSFPSTHPVTSGSLLTDTASYKNMVQDKIDDTIGVKRSLRPKLEYNCPQQECQKEKSQDQQDLEFEEVIQCLCEDHDTMST